MVYVVVSYVWYEYEDGEIIVWFVVVKVKVVFIKVISIFRLEFMVVVLGLRLFRKVLELLEVFFENCILWIDSEDVICWI